MCRVGHDPDLHIPGGQDLHEGAASGALAGAWSINFVALLVPPLNLRLVSRALWSERGRVRSRWVQIALQTIRTRRSCWISVV